MDQELLNIIEGCQKKKSDSQRKLYTTYSDIMFGICLRYSSCSEDAEDVLQDGFLKIFEKINQFEFKGSFEGWMKKIMINTSLEKYRTQYKVINIQDGMNYEKEGLEDVSDLITADELIALIQDLSPKYRMVFNLYAIEGYSHKEISEMLDISEGTSKSNLSRARIILQEKVKSFYGSSIQTG